MAEEQIITSTEEEIIDPILPSTSLDYANFFGTLAGVAVTAVLPDQTDFGERFLASSQNMIAKMEQGLEQEVRNNIALQKQREELGFINELLLTEIQGNAGADLELIEGAIQLEEAKQFQLDQDAIEKQALDRIEQLGLLAETNQGVAELLLDEEIRGDAFDVIRDKLERRTIMHREAQKISEDYQDQSVVGKLIDILGHIVPAAKMTATDNLPGGIPGIIKLSGSSIFDASKMLMNISREEFDELYPKVYKAIREESGYIGENFSIASDVAENLLSINTTDRSIANGFDFVDIGGALFDIATIKILGKLGKAAFVRHGRARELSAQMTVASLDESAEAAAKGVKEIDEITALDEAMPAATKTTESNVPGIDVSVSPAVTAELRLQEEIMERLVAEVDDISRVSDEVLDRVTEEAIEALKKELGNVVDFKVIEETGQRFVRALLGKKGGASGFSRPSDAKGAASRMGILDYEVIQAIDGQFFIKTKFSINEGKYMAINETKATQSGPWSTFLRSSASTQDQFLHDRAVQAGMKSSRFREMIKPLMEPLRLLNKKSKLAVEAVWERGNVAQKWYTPNQFAGHFKDLHDRLPTQGELLGYMSLRRINDVDYHFLNHDMYTRKFNDGWLTGSYETPDFNILPTNVKRVEDVAETGRMVIHDAKTGKVLEGKDITVTELKDRLKSGDELYKLDRPVDTPDGSVQYVIGRKGNMKISPLRYNQVKYTAGGHRLYDGKYFVKMAVTDTLKSGTSIIKNPKTFIVAKTRGEAQEWSDKWNEMIDAYRAFEKTPTDPKALKHLETTLARNGFEEGVEDFAAIVKREKLNGDHRLEVAFDREEPSAYATLRSREDVYDQTSVIGPHESWYETSGRMYYSRKGKPLKGPQEERASFIDPFKTAQMAIETNIHRAAFTNFRVAAINTWMNTFSKYLPKNGKAPESNFFSDVALESGDQFVRQRAEQLRKVIKRQIGTRSSNQEAMEIGVRRFAEWVEGTTGSSKAASAVFNIFSRDPITALKSLAFDLKLGLFEPSQLLIQTQTATAMAFVDPVGFAKFGRDLIPIRWALANGTDEVGSVLGKMSSMDAGEFKSFMRVLNESGAMNVGNELVYFERATLEPLSQGKAAVGRIRQWGRYPFYEAERINRIASFRIAWNKLRDEVPLEKMTSKENRAKLAGMTDKFSMNMTQASSAAWQKGILSASTQFLSYQTRFIENILPKIGSKQWTTSEKIRLAASQIALYGAAGVPMGQYLLAQLTSSNPELRDLAEENPTLYRAATGGLIDSMLFAISGGSLDVAASDRVAIAKGVEDTLAKLFGQDSRSTSFLEMLGGAPLAIGLELGSDIVSAYNLMQVAAHSEQVAATDIVPIIFNEIASNASTFSRMSRAYLAFQYGNYYSSRSGKILTDVTTPEAFAIGLGIQPRELRDIGLNIDMMKAREEAIKSMTAPIAKLRRQAFEAYAQGDRDKANQLFRIISGHLSMLPMEDRLVISTRAMGRGELFDLSDSLKNGLFKSTGQILPSTEGNQ